jgi:hypothetical protein
VRKNALDEIKVLAHAKVPIEKKEGGLRPKYAEHNTNAMRWEN